MDIRNKSRENLVALPWPEVTFFASQTLGHGDSQKASTPEWMVFIGDITSSQVDGAGVENGPGGLDSYIQLFGWADQSARDTSGYSTNEYFTSASMQMQNPVIVIKNGTHTPIVESKLYGGNIIGTISVVRLQNISDVDDINVVRQEVKYEGCNFTRVKQEEDYLWVQFIAKQRTNTWKQYSEGEMAQGNNVSFYDYVAASPNPSS